MQMKKKFLRIPCELFFIIWLKDFFFNAFFSSPFTVQPTLLVPYAVLSTFPKYRILCVFTVLFFTSNALSPTTKF